MAVQLILHFFLFKSTTCSVAVLVAVLTPKAGRAAAVDDSGTRRRAAGSCDTQLRARASVHMVAALQHVTFDRHLGPWPCTAHIETNRRWRWGSKNRRGLGMGVCQAWPPSARLLPPCAISNTRTKQIPYKDKCAVWGGGEGAALALAMLGLCHLEPEPCFPRD